MYITITDIIGEKTIDLVYPIQGKEIAVVSMFSDNVQCDLITSWMVEFGESWSKQIMAETYTK